MLLEQLVNGLALGMAYGLVAVGYSMVFGVLRLINFSHGAVYAFGAYAVWFLIDRFQFDVIPAILASVLLTGFLGYLLNKICLEPLRKRGEPGISALITTIGMAYIILNTLTFVFGAQIRRFPPLFHWGNIDVFGAAIGWQQIMIALACITLLAGLWILVHHTKIGLAMRAVEQMPIAASINGINVNTVVSFTFFLGSAAAAIASTLLASYYQYIRPTIGDTIALKAFGAAVLGGIGSLAGSAVGGVIIGVSESLTVYFWGSTYIDLVAYLILFLVLIARPTGLLGRKNIDKV